MKAFNFLRLCRSTNIVTIPAVLPHSAKLVHDESYEDDTECCFDLDISSLDYNHKENTNNTSIQKSPCDKKNNIVNEKQPEISQRKVSSDKRKIIPIDQSSSSMPQYPNLKASPAFWFKKVKSIEAQRTNQAEPRGESKVGRRIRKGLSDKFKLENVPSFRKEYIVKIKQKAEDSSFMQKYLNMFKQGNKKMSSKKKNETTSISGYNSAFSSPRKAGNKSTFVGIKMVGTSRSPRAPASSPVMIFRRDDSAMEQQDSITGAILHCKQSFNS